MSYWAGVLSGCCAAVILFTAMMFSIIEQNNVLREQNDRLRDEIKALDSKVAEHEKIMRAYKFFNWKMSFMEDK